MLQIKNLKLGLLGTITQTIILDKFTQILLKDQEFSQEEEDMEQGLEREFILLMPQYLLHLDQQL